LAVVTVVHDGWVSQKVRGKARPMGVAGRGIIRRGGPERCVGQPTDRSSRLHKCGRAGERWISQKLAEPGGSALEAEGALERRLTAQQLCGRGGLVERSKRRSRGRVVSRVCETQGDQQ